MPGLASVMRACKLLACLMDNDYYLTWKILRLAQYPSSAVLVEKVKPKLSSWDADFHARYPAQYQSICSVTIPPLTKQQAESMALLTVLVDCTFPNRHDLNHWLKGVALSTFFEFTGKKRGSNTSSMIKVLERADFSKEIPEGQPWEIDLRVTCVSDSNFCTLTRLTILQAIRHTRLSASTKFRC